MTTDSPNTSPAESGAPPRPKKPGRSWRRGVIQTHCHRGHVRKQHNDGAWYCPECNRLASLAWHHRHKVLTGKKRGPSPLPAEQRFWRYVQKSEGCWVWTGLLHRAGYGRFFRSDRTGVTAHRFSYELHHGAIPGGLWVLHRCDNPPCVNPAHLFLGDAQANIDDMWAKGRGHGVRGGARRMEREARRAGGAR